MNPNTDYATCDLCDAHKNDASGSFRVLPPVFHNYGQRVNFMGRVSTVKCFEDNSGDRWVRARCGRARALRRRHSRACADAAAY